MAQALVRRKGSGLIPVHYGSTSTSTSSHPDPAEIGRVYQLQRRQESSRAAVDWEAEAALWGEETRAWAEEVRLLDDDTPE